jgi:hypothetical protein
MTLLVNVIFSSLLLLPLPLIGPNTLLSTLSSNTLSLYSSFNATHYVSYPYNTTGKLMVLYALNFRFLDRRWEDKRF